MATAARDELFLVRGDETDSHFGSVFRPVLQPGAACLLDKPASSAHLQMSLPLENVDERMTSGAIQA